VRILSVWQVPLFCRDLVYGFILLSVLLTAYYKLMPHVTHNYQHSPNCTNCRTGGGVNIRWTLFRNVALNNFYNRQYFFYRKL